MIVKQRVVCDWECLYIFVIDTPTGTYHKIRKIRFIMLLSASQGIRGMWGAGSGVWNVDFENCVRLCCDAEGEPILKAEVRRMSFMYYLIARKYE
jgi:hypothetical protein